MDHLQFTNQFSQLFRHILRQSTDFLNTGHIVVLLIEAGTLALLIAQSVVGPLGQKPLELTNQSLTQRFPLLKGVQHPVVGGHGVLDLKQRPHISGIARHTAVVEDLPGIVVGDPVILDFGGVVNEGYAVPVHLAGDIGGGLDFLFLPNGNNILIAHPNHLTKTLAYFPLVRKAFDQIRPVLPPAPGRYRLP